MKVQSHFRSIFFSGIAASFLFAAAPAFAAGYSYQCLLNLPLGNDVSYEYEIKADAEYDLERAALTGITNPSISVYLNKDGSRVETYVLEQPLDLATLTDRYAVLDYKEAAVSLNARLSLAGGPEEATAKVYHVYKQGSRVSSTELVACEFEAK